MGLSAVLTAQNIPLIDWSKTALNIFIYLFIYLLVLPYYNTQNYYKNKNNIHDYIGRETATA